MSTPTISTPGRIPVINFGDDSDYAGIGTVLAMLAEDVTWQVEVNNSDILDGKVPNDFHVGFVTPNHDDTITIKLWDESTSDCTGPEITVNLDDVIAITYL